MKTAYGCLEKGHETHEKKKKNSFQEENWNRCTEQKKIGGAHKFCFTNMKTVLQKCVPNKLTFLKYSK